MLDQGAILGGRGALCIRRPPTMTPNAAWKKPSVHGRGTAAVTSAHTRPDVIENKSGNKATASFDKDLIAQLVKNATGTARALSSGGVTATGKRVSQGRCNNYFLGLMEGELVQLLQHRSMELPGLMESSPQQRGVVGIDFEIGPPHHTLRLPGDNILWNRRIIDR